MTRQPHVDALDTAGDRLEALVLSPPVQRRLDVGQCPGPVERLDRCLQLPRLTHQAHVLRLNINDGRAS